MSADWPIVSLSTIVNFKTGRLDSNAAEENGNYPFFTCSPTTLTINSYKFDEEAILLAGNNANGIFSVKYYKGKFNAYQRTYIITPINKSKLSVRWLYFRIKYMTDELRQMSIGTATKFLTKKILDSYEIRLPPYREQERVADVLWAFEDKLNLNTQTNQTLEEIAQAIFQSWFIDFDPVKAKIAVLEAGGTAEEAEHAAMCTISGKDKATLVQMQSKQPDDYARLAQTAALFPSAMQNSELGDIPDGWEIDFISEFGQIICGKTPSKSKPEFFGNDIPFIKIPDMHNAMFVVSPNEWLSNKGADTQTNKKLPRGSICISCIATVGKVIITTQDSHTNQQINSIVPKNSSLTPYLYFYMKTLNKHFHDLASGGSATLNMNTSTFSGVKILKPPINAVEKFYNAVEASLKKIENNLNESLALAELRDALLPELLAGNIELYNEEHG